MGVKLGSLILREERRLRVERRVLRRMLGSKKGRNDIRLWRMHYKILHEVVLFAKRFEMF
jgi:hypothetical protein